MTTLAAAALLGLFTAFSPASGPAGLPDAGPEQVMPVSATSFTSLINTVRSDAGLRQIAPHPLLERAAQAHADDMLRNGYFSHTGRNGSKVRDRISAQGYRGCFWAENIAYGNLSAPVVFQRWMESRGHRRNMLHRRPAHFGLASAGSGQNTFWVLVFGAPC